MTPETIQMQLKLMQEYFNRSTGPLKDEHSGYRPTEGQFSVAEQMAHTAQTIDWFFSAAFTNEWNMDFEGLEKETRACKTVSEARAWFDRSITKAVEIAGAHSAEEWASPFPPNQIMGEIPRFSIVGALSDHTAHHRGALTVYQRLLGLVAPMPYM